VSDVNGDIDQGPRHLAYLLHTVMRRLRAEGEDAAGAMPIQAAQARLLDLIPRAGGRLTELALAMRISKQGLGQLAASLAAGGYAEMLPDPADNRAKIIRRTPSGDELQQAMRSAIMGVEKRWRTEVGDERYATLIDVLEVLAGNE
jgi:DNA-binding MarR family transcriptional regulator